MFFDACGIKYLYEPEGFELDDGTYYLPDFYLPDVGGRAKNGLWVEVKGKMTAEDKRKIEQFCGSDEFNTPSRSILVVGEVPMSCDRINYEVSPFADMYWNCETIDGDCYPIEFYRGSNGEIGIWGWDNVDDYSGFEWFNDKYLKARQARFENGEKP